MSDGMTDGARCCERDHDGDGNCDRHPEGYKSPTEPESVLVPSRSELLELVWSIASGGCSYNKFEEHDEDCARCLCEALLAGGGS